MTKMLRLMSTMALVVVLAAASPAQLGKGRGGGGGAGGGKEQGGGSGPKKGPGGGGSAPPVRGGGSTGPAKGPGGGSTGGGSNPPVRGGGNQGGGSGGNLGKGRGNGGGSTGRGSEPPVREGGPQGGGGGLGKGNGGGSKGGGSNGGGSGGGSNPPVRGGGNQGGGSGGDLGKGRGTGTGNTGGGNSRDRDTGPIRGGNTGPVRGGDVRGGTSNGNTRAGGQGLEKGGRITNPAERGQRLKDIPSRTGNPNYGTVNNQFNGNKNARPQSFQVPSLNKGSIAQQALRSGNAQPVHYRSGYYQYGNNWRDDYFRYSYYQFSFGNNRCSVSPWYYYWNLPPYISVTRIIYVDNFRGCNWGYGDVYTYRVNSPYLKNNPYYGGSVYKQTDLDYALEDLEYAWEYADRRSISRLVPDRGRVNIYHDGQYSYSLSSDDFYDMLVDAVYATDTENYEIASVRVNRNEATVTGKHYFYDAWGGRQVVYHSYRLEREGRDWVITDFSTGTRSLW